MNEKLKEKIRESLTSVIPITIIVMIICFFITPITSDLMIMFIIGSVFLIFGMGLFSLGVDMSMTSIGERIGANLNQSKKIWIIALIAFLVGTITTIAEPDLQVLATQINEIPNMMLVGTVGLGVGVFLAIAMLRIVFKIRLSSLLVFLYIIVFAISFFVPENFLPIAFDSGGVTTGPITVPFIIALGVGAAAIRNDKDSESDSFGLVSLCSIGPIIAVMILGILFHINGVEYTPIHTSTLNNSQEIGNTFVGALHHYCIEVAKSIAPIIVFFVLYNIFKLKLPANKIKKISIGFLYTFVGIVLFLTGVNIGFLPVGNVLGNGLMVAQSKSIVLMIMFFIGFFVVNAEPAVQVLTKQVSDITDGAISRTLLSGTLSLGMIVALVIACFRVWYGIPIYLFLIPGYTFALFLTFFAPEIFTGIAFDSGGVASGPMTASFILPLVIGMCEASGRLDINIMKDAFGLIAMVAMMPLITIQLVGVAYKYRSKLKIDFEIGARVPKEQADDIIVFKKIK